MDETRYQTIAQLRAEGLGALRISKRLKMAKSQVQQVFARLDGEAAARNGQGHEPTPAATTAAVPLAALALGDETQARAGLNPATIAAYVEALSEGAQFPPVVLFTQGDECFWIGDGYHRIAAARQVGFTTIRAEVRPGSKREALFCAIGSNIRHGRPRTNADKRKAVDLMLRDTEWGTWSDNQIAKHCGVTHPFVGDVRRSLEPVTSDGGQRTYINKYGQEATMNTRRIGATPGTTARPPRPRRRPEPPALSPQESETRRWYLLVAGLRQVVTDFAHSGGLEPLLALWTPAQRTRAKDELGQLREQLDRLDAQLPAEDRLDG
jgi:hypothetical protein